MTMHSSLNPKTKGKGTRSVLKRFERLKELLEKEKWKIGDSVFGLPKLKAIQLKLKKSKKAQEEAAGAEGAPAEGAEASTEKPAAGAPEKKAEKKPEKK